MSVFNFTQSSSSPLPSDSNSSLSNTIFSENSPPLLIIAAFLGIGLIGGTILACYSWRRMRTRMLPPGSRSLQYDHRLDLGEMGATKSTSSGDRPQLWDLWTEKDRERDRYASGDDNWDRVLPLSVIPKYDTASDTNQRHDTHDLRRNRLKEVAKGNDVSSNVPLQITMAIAMPSPLDHCPLENRRRLDYCIGVVEVLWDAEEE